ncbi:MAG: class I SAM-dependent DNA methyltransferase [Desulfitobacterium sp.]
MNFSIEATNWDNERRVKRAKIIADEIIKSIQIDEQYRALEFGCGTGLVSFNLIDKFKHITLIDTSKGMIDTLNLKIQALKVKNMTAIQVDANFDSHIQGEKFDVIYTSMALHHVIDITTILNKLFSLLNENGYLCIIELVEDDGSFHKLETDFDGHNGFNQNKLKDLLVESGFKCVETNTFYKDVKVIDGSEVNYSLFHMVGRK